MHITITKSSAGSGKTHSLTEEYLKILFSTKDINLPNKILAITFTNMATYEIRERVIKYLKFYSLAECESKEIFSKLSINLNNEKVLISNKILDNFFKFNSNFNISTIDSFTVSISRFLSENLKILGNFEPVMSIKNYIDEIID
ncbi:MAG: UvrD-helicase domain-containing protein, partial [Candidatus Altarchaeaceae archaeon]